MFISVKILQGEECTIEVSGVSASSSISAVKHLVAQQLQIPVDQQRLVFRGKTLSDSLSLGDYNIVEGNRLHLFVLKAADNATVVWDQMRKFLLSQFSHEDAEKVLEEYKKDFSQSVAGLSLDDIERLASSSLGTTSTTTSTSGDTVSRPPPGRGSGSSLLVLSNDDTS